MVRQRSAKSRNKVNFHFIFRCLAKFNYYTFYQQMPSFIFKEKRYAYAVHSVGNGKRKWVFLGSFPTRNAGHLAYEKHVQFYSQTKENKKGMFVDIGEKFLAHAKITWKPLTYEGNKRDFEALKKFFKDFRIDQITPSLLEEFVQKNKKWKPTTSRNRLGLLKKIMEYAKGHGFKVNDPFATIKIPRPQLYQFDPKVCPDDVLQEFFKVLEDRFKPVAMILRYTGIRPVELSRLTPANVDFENKLLTILSSQSKTKHPRQIPIHPSIVSYLEMIPFKHKHHHLTNAFKVACRKIKAKGKVTPYVLRHQFATDLLNCGADIRTVQVLMGHTDIRMTARYTNPNLATKQKAIEMLK